MKIKSIAAICKKNKNIAIFERYSDDGDILTQYIGDGSAVYPVIGLPPLDAESLLTIFDVPEKDRDNYFVKTLGIPAGISFEDTDATERQVEREGISIIYSGRTLKPIHTTRGLVFIESRYLAPVADVLDVLELYERRTTEGTPYIVAKAGFLLQAVIMPYDVINQQFVESFSRLKRIFKDLDKNKLQTVESLIKNAAFMAVSLEELQEIINEEGYTVEYQNGANQSGTKQSDAVKTHIAMTKNHAAIIKQL